MTEFGAHSRLTAVDPLAERGVTPWKHLSPSANRVRITAINGEKLVMPLRHVLLAAAALAVATPILGADAPPPLIERAKLFGNPDKAGAPRRRDERVGGSDRRHG